jgi:hypothetical protein
MMEKTKCRRLITIQHSMGSLINGIKTDFVSRGSQTSRLRIDEVPALKDLYPALVSDSPTEATVPYPQISRPSKNDILLYLHSSGSTDFPKPIPMTNISAVHWCLTRKFRTDTRSYNMLRWVTTSRRSRPYQRSNSYPHRCCIRTIIPYFWFMRATVGANCVIDQRVNLSAHVLPKPLSGSYNTERSEYPGFRNQDEIERCDCRANLSSAMGIVAERC